MQIPETCIVKASTMAARLENEVKSRTLQPKKKIESRAPATVKNEQDFPAVYLEHGQDNVDGLKNDAIDGEFGLQENGGRYNSLDVAKVSELLSSVFSALTSPRGEAFPMLKMVHAHVKCNL